MDSETICLPNHPLGNTKGLFGRPDLSSISDDLHGVKDRRKALLVQRNS